MLKDEQVLDIAMVNNIQVSLGNPIANMLVDPFNPYFLHLSESPRLVLVSTPFNESNYHFWS